VGSAAESEKIGQDGVFECSTRKLRAEFIPREHWEMLASTTEILLIEWSCLAKVILAWIGAVVRVFNHGACVRWMRRIISGRIDPGKRYS
jgi:hypothetical protein